MTLRTAKCSFREEKKRNPEIKKNSGIWNAYITVLSGSINETWPSTTKRMPIPFIASKKS